MMILKRPMGRFIFFLYDDEVQRNPTIFANRPIGGIIFILYDDQTPRNSMIYQSTYMTITKRCIQ